MSGARLGYAAIAAPDEPGYNEEILIVVFLRGGLDGLSLVGPIEGPDRSHYESYRPNLKLAATGDNKALPLDAPWGLNPQAAALHPIYQDGKLAFIQAIGMANGTRSHFDAQEFMELGTPGLKTARDGWLTRHLKTADNIPPEILMPSMAVSSIQPTSLRGDRDTLTFDGLNSFGINSGHWFYVDRQKTSLRRLFNLEDSRIHDAGVQALNAADIIGTYLDGSYSPANGAVYPNNNFGRQLQNIAQMTKIQVGLRVVTIDLGGWDTHEEQGNDGGGYIGGQLNTLCGGLAALYQDLNGEGAANFMSKTTVVVQSEFGRRIRENASRGTDHGTGNLMMVMGGNVVGGVHGEWPGLHPDQLYDNADLAPTNDYRRILSEIVIRRLENPRLGQIFPGFDDYVPLGVVTGADLPPDYNGAAPSNDLLPFKNLTTLGGGWKNSPWFGAFRDDRAPWIYHREHGFLYVKGTDEKNLWLYQPSLGWVHTGQGIYPHLYSRNRESWIFHEAGSREPRHFYDFSLQEWFAVSN